MRTVGAVAIGFVCAIGTPPAMGASRADNVKVVRNDFGGRIRIRAAEVARLADAGIRVEIRGRSCLSSCTMYLGLPDTCVEPKTSFGFHAPSFYGAKLSARDFKYWSSVIASHYPEPIRSWYLQHARDTTTGFHRLSGSQLIRLGFPECD